MPYFKTSQEWLDQSALLIEARPATTRVTTRYSIKPVKPRKSESEDPNAAAAQPTEPKPPRAVLVLKTYDPVSGVTLKYKTTKAAEVSRLVYAALGRLGRGMAGVPDIPEEGMPDADAAGTSTPAEGNAAGEAQQTQQQGGGGKKKKKGKK
ncbi:hypothetical protein PT974_10291 [Cladobotryum mycophilum]|uniref:SRP9 domain-containing protein n=1 Tax=Cladobotryum mycophilum TaxID=491253 RepID=A0ABR0SAH5_9HYPO